jgi:hypothetical protein
LAALFRLLNYRFTNRHHRDEAVKLVVLAARQSFICESWSFIVSAIARISTADLVWRFHMHLRALQQYLFG